MKAILVAVSALPGCMVWRQNSFALRNANGAPVHACPPGTPDILGVYRGRAIGIEVKTPTGQQSQAQKRWQAAWERGGGLYILARSPEESLAALTNIVER